MSDGSSLIKRDIVRDACVFDPKIAHGRFHVLGRTDGLWIVYDPSMPLAKGTVGGPFRSQAEADHEARRLALVLPSALVNAGDPSADD